MNNTFEAERSGRLRSIAFSHVQIK